MPRLTRIYTRTGDDGSTALGFGARTPKDALRVECYGTVDELNSQLGTALCQALPEDLAGPLGRIQNDLFHLGADLCVTEAEKAQRPLPRIEARHVAWIEGEIGAWNEGLPSLDPAFVARTEGQIRDGLAALETECQGRSSDWWFGVEPGHDDNTVACVARFLSEAYAYLVKLPDYPALADHSARAEARTEFKAIQQEFIPPN